MPGFMFLSKSGQRVDARDYHNRTNHSEGAKLGGDVLQSLGKEKLDKKPGAAPGLLLLVKTLD